MKTKSTKSWAPAALLAVSVTVTISSCGYDGNAKKDPATKQVGAQGVVETFVEVYNDDGFGEAVRGTFCSANVAANEGKEAPDGVSYAPGSMSVLSPASVSGVSARAVVRASTVDFSVALQNDSVQGWCITGLSAATGGAGSAGQ